MPHVRILLFFVLYCGHFCAVKAEVVTQALLIIRSDGVQVHFDIEFANTPASRGKGLMDRNNLAPRHGMWFDFKTERKITMWMKNTTVSLDMLFVDRGGTIVYLREWTEPLSLDHIESPVPARYVLELNAGEISTYGLSVGDSVFLP